MAKLIATFIVELLSVRVEEFIWAGAYPYLLVVRRAGRLVM
jgi:hypothetical protein